MLWRPASVETHPLGNALDRTPKPHSSALAYLGRVKTPSKPAGAYRPPGARGQVTPLHFKREDEGGAAHVSNGPPIPVGAINGFGKPRRRDVPGAEAAPSALPPGAAPGGGVSLSGVNDGESGLSKSAAKNKKKREAKKAKEATEKPPVSNDGAASAPPPGGSPDRKGRKEHTRNDSKSNVQGRSRSQRPDRADAARSTDENAAGHIPNAKVLPSLRQTGHELASRSGTLALATESNAGPDPAVTSPGGGSLEQKKLRGMLKKLRAIEDLKMRLAGGEKLEDTQMKKIGTEDSVRQELEESGWTG